MPGAWVSRATDIGINSLCLRPDRAGPVISSFSSWTERLASCGLKTWQRLEVRSREDRTMDGIATFDLLTPRARSPQLLREEGPW